MKTQTVFVETKDLDRLRRTLKKISKESGRVLEDVYESYSAQIVAAAVSWTYPINQKVRGQNMKAQEIGMNAVARDARKVYRTASEVYGQLQRTDGEPVAKAFWFAFANGHFGEAQDILRHSRSKARGVAIIPFDNGAGLDRRRNKRGRVNERGQEYLPQEFFRSGDRDRLLIKPRQELVGFTKAGWLAGLRVRKKRGGYGVPSWVMKWRGRSPSGYRKVYGVVGFAGMDFMNKVRWVATVFQQWRANALIWRILNRAGKDLEKLIEQRSQTLLNRTNP